MEASEYFQVANYIADEIIRASKTDISKMNEQEKQIMGAFCFGTLNGYSLENQISAVRIQSAMIAVLVQKFQYDPASAAQFCDFLIRCTDKNYHSTMYAIIHRGMEGYYQLGDTAKLEKNLSGTIKTIKKYSE
jgi:hypothetical protein